MTKKIILLIPIILLAFLASGCAPIQSGEQIAMNGETYLLASGQTIGQTFTARYDGLEAINLFLTPVETGRGTVQLSLKPGVDSDTVIAQVSLPLSELESAGYQRFDFPPINASAQEAYYLELALIGAGQISVASGDAWAYEQGALYLDQTPQDAQLTFQLTYTFPRLITGLLRQAAGWVWQLILAGLAFLLPGWALLAGIWPDWPKQDNFSKIALAGGLSLALYPLLMLWTDAIGLHLGAAYVWLPMLAGAAFLLWRGRAQIREVIKTPKKTFKSAWQNLKNKEILPMITLLIITGLVILVRFWHIRTLSFPLWGDSQHHTVIVQLFLDNKGLFNSWLPYAPYETYTTHFGFHANSAIFAWISGQTAPHSVLAMGQFFNIMAVLSLYPLARKLTKGSAWAGIGAILGAGLLSTMPAFYINWGRYAQLAGQTLLPVAVFFLMDAFQKGKQTLPHAVVTGLVFSGMLISYYRTPIFLIAFLPILLAVYADHIFPLKKAKEKSLLVWLFSFGGILALGILPLYFRLNQGVLITNVGESRELSVRLQSILNNLNTWRTWRDLYPLWLLLLAGAGWLAALLRKKWLLATLPLGVALAQAYQFGRLINLPLAKYVQPFSIMIFLYLPIGLLVGMIAEGIAGWMPKAKNILLTILLVPLALFGVWQIKGLVNTRTYALVTDADQRAYQWVRENTSPEARFLVEGFLIYNGSSIVGSDGGWWIPLMTQRQNTMPPQYALLNEQPLDPAYNEKWINLVRVLNLPEPSPDQLQEAICAADVTHIYIGQKQGSVGFDANPLFTPADFTNQSAFQTIYNQDRVWIFEINPDFCQQP